GRGYLLPWCGFVAARRGPCRRRIAAGRLAGGATRRQTQAKAIERARGGGRMSAVAIIGTQWGDEGKGKITDLLALRADWVVRFQGGNNAGHTVVAEGRTLKLHLLPSGISHVGKTCVMGNGVVIDPLVLVEEIDRLLQQDLTLARLSIS